MKMYFASRQAELRKAGKGRLRGWTGTGFALILLTCNSGPAQELGRSQEAAPDARNLCGSLGHSPTRVLLGRFSLVNDGEEGKTNQLETILPAIIAGSVPPNGNIQIFLVDKTLQRFNKDTQLLIDSAFLQGTQANKSRNTKIADLARVLRNNNCEYLLGGQIILERGSTTVSTYVLNAREASPKIERLEPVVQGRDAAPWGLAFHISHRLETFLRSSHFSPSPSLPIGVSCFQYVGTGPLSKTALDSMVRDIQLNVTGSLSVTERFRNIVEPPSTSESCASSQHYRARIGGEIRFGKDLSVQPLVTLAAGTGSVGPIRLSALHTSRNNTIAAQFASDVKAFLLAITSEAGDWPSELDVRIAMDEAVPSAKAVLAAEGTESGLLRAYVGLSNFPDNAYASLHLARALIQKKMVNAAMDFLNLLQASPLLDSETNTLFQVTFAEALLGLGAKESARTHLEAAFDKILELSSDARTPLAHLAASLLLRAGSPDAARDLLVKAGRPSELYDYTFLLGQIARTQERFEEAALWFERARELPNNDPQLRPALASTFAALGEKALFVDRDYTAARRHFLRSLSEAKDSRVSFLAGLTAYEAGNYDQAITDFRKLTTLDPSSANLRWIEAAWLTSLEGLILNGNYLEAIDQARVASETIFSNVTPSKVLSLYMAATAKILLGQFAEREDASTLQLSTSGAKELRWDNSKLEAYINEKLADDPERVRQFKEITRKIFEPR